MILLPDYPDKVVLAHRLRVERLALLCTLVLIAGGGWWLLPAVNGGAELLPRSGPVLALFASGLLIADLIEYGPVERSRLAAAANIAWPSVLAFADQGVAIGQAPSAAHMVAHKCPKLGTRGCSIILPHNLFGDGIDFDNARSLKKLQIDGRKSSGPLVVEDQHIARPRTIRRDNMRIVLARD